MSFNAAMFDPASLVTKRDDGASGLAPGEPGAQQQQNTGYSRTASGGYQPDPAVTDRRGGARPGVPSDVSRMRSSTGTAPGEPVNAVAVPSIVKAGTSGTETPIAAIRYATRPGAGRHPSTGRFTEGQGVAAGYSSLDQQPHGSGVFPSAGDGPFAAQVHDPMTRPVGETSPGSALEYELNRHAASVGARRLDLAGPAGMPDGLAHEVDPSPVWVRQSGLNDLVHGRVQATPADIPSGTPGSAANWGGPSTHPLATAIASHGSAAFGFQPSNVSLGFRE